MEMEGAWRMKAAKKSQNLQKVTFDLPDDLTIEIISRLPVKSLLQYKSVCKTWYDLIQTRTFVTKHQRNSSRIPHPLLVYTKETFRDGRKFLYFHCSEALDRPIYVDFPSSVGFRIVGVCCGLVCAHDRLRKMFIIGNPVTMRFRQIIFPSITLKKEDVVFFGFDVLENSQILVKVVYSPSPDGKFVVSTEMYTMDPGGDTLKEICVRIGEGGTILAKKKLCVLHDLKARKPVVKNGIFYWEADLSRDACVVSFDISKGLFDIITTPFDASLVRWNLREIKGEVSVIIYHGDRWFELFVLNNNKRSWSVKHEIANIPMRACGRDFERGRVSVLGCTRNDELVLEDRFENHVSLLLFDSKSRRTKCLFDCGVKGFEAYLTGESLLSVNH